jgi:hypothetical protein
VLPTGLRVSRFTLSAHFLISIEAGPTVWMPTGMTSVTSSRSVDRSRRRTPAAMRLYQLAALTIDARLAVADM